MLALHAAWSDSLCSGPSATSRKAGVDSPSGTEKLSGTNGSAQPRSPTERAISKIEGSPVIHVTSSWQRLMRQPCSVRTTVFV